MNVYKIVYTINGDDMFGMDSVFDADKLLAAQDIKEAMDSVSATRKNSRASYTQWKVYWIVAVSASDAMETAKEIRHLQEPDEEFEIVEVKLVAPHLLCSPRHKDELTIDQDGWLKPSNTW